MASEPTMCRWFALCDHEATGTMPHPILGAVPICDRCAAKYAADAGDREPRDAMEHYDEAWNEEN